MKLKDVDSLPVKCFTQHHFKYLVLNAFIIKLTSKLLFEVLICKDYNIYADPAVQKKKVKTERCSVWGQIG